MLKVRCSESDWRGVDYARKYAIAPFAILRRTDSRIDLLGAFACWVVPEIVAWRVRRSPVEHLSREITIA